MTRLQHWLAVACLGVCLGAQPAAAQSLCQPKESINRCLDRLETLKAKATTEMKAETVKVQADVKKKTETGIQDMNGLTSSVKDFLPLLQMNGLIGGVTQDDSTGTVSFTVNTRFFSQDPSLQVKAVFETKPKLFDELRSRLPASTREARAKALLESKIGAEHTTIHASYNVTTERLGRNFARHMTLYNDLFQTAVAGRVSANVSAQSDVMRKLITAVGNDVSLDDTPWSDIPEAKRAAAQSIIAEVHEAEMALRTEFARAVRDTGLDLFGQLINNQPQLVITMTPAFRDDLFGPNVFSGRVAFEMGLSDNLNGFLKRMNSAACRTQSDQCLQHYAEYANEPETRANIKAGSRLAAYLEFTRAADYRFINAEAGLDVAFPTSNTVSAGLDYGTLFGVSDLGAADGRVDASVRFERRSNALDEMRFVASVVLTKKVGDISVPFGIVYANKPRFLTGVDKGLTANVGLKFNLFPGSK